MFAADVEWVLQCCRNVQLRPSTYSIEYSVFLYFSLSPNRPAAAMVAKKENEKLKRREKSFVKYIGYYILTTIEC